MAQVEGETKDGYLAKSKVSEGIELGTYRLTDTVTSLNQDGSVATNHGMGRSGGF